MQHAQVLTTGEAANRLRVSGQRVRQLDGELQPLRTPTGRRVYLVDVVEACAGRRAAAAKEKSR